MPKDSPGYDRDVKDRGLGANDATDPTLASYLSSLLYALSVPSFLVVAYLGNLLGYYPPAYILVVFGGCMLGTVLLAVLVMHLRT